MNFSCKGFNKTYNSGYPKRENQPVTTRLRNNHTPRNDHTPASGSHEPSNLNTLKTSSLGGKDEFGEPFPSPPNWIQNSGLITSINENTIDQDSMILYSYRIYFVESVQTKTLSESTGLIEHDQEAFKEYTILQAKMFIDHEILDNDQSDNDQTYNERILEAIYKIKNLLPEVRKANNIEKINDLKWVSSGLIELSSKLNAEESTILLVLLAELSSEIDSACPPTSQTHIKLKYGKGSFIIGVTGDLMWVQFQGEERKKDVINERSSFPRALTFCEMQEIWKKKYKREISIEQWANMEPDSSGSKRLTTEEADEDVRVLTLKKNIGDAELLKDVKNDFRLFYYVPHSRNSEEMVESVTLQNKKAICWSSDGFRMNSKYAVDGKQLERPSFSQCWWASRCNRGIPCRFDHTVIDADNPAPRHEKPKGPKKQSKTSNRV